LIIGSREGCFLLAFTLMTIKKPANRQTGELLYFTYISLRRVGGALLDIWTFAP